MEPLPMHNSILPPFDAYLGDEPCLFVSYSHKDSNLVYPEILRLHAQGFRIWYDEGIEPGNEWPEEVARALDACSLFLVFISPRAVASSNVRNEIHYALNAGKPFLAVYFEETELPKGLKLRMGDLQAILTYNMSETRYRAWLERTLPAALKRPSVPSASLLLPQPTEVDIPKTAASTDPPVGLANTTAATSTPTQLLADTAESREDARSPQPLDAEHADPPTTDLLSTPTAADGTEAESAVATGFHAQQQISPEVIKTISPNVYRRAALVGSVILGVMIVFFAGHKWLFPPNHSLDVPKAPVVNSGGDNHGEKRNSLNPDTTLPKFKKNAKDDADMILIPAGEFTMGNNDRDAEKPVHKVMLDGYYIYRNPVTVAQYLKFCKATGHAMPKAPAFNPNWSKLDHPIVFVTYDDALAYCKWAGVKLPTEAQWEKAASWDDVKKEQRTYPWGNNFDKSKLWSAKSGVGGGTKPVGSSPLGESPFGVLDLEGNVWQWCRDFYDGEFYASRSATERNPDNQSVGNKSYRVLRGGSWGGDDPGGFRSAYRYVGEPGNGFDDTGFRCTSEP